MEFLAHIDSENNERVQTVIEHLTNVASMAGDFAAAFGDRAAGETVGRYHDIGKYSAEFQKRIRGESNKRVDHSTAGAKELFALAQEHKTVLHLLAAYCVAGHHGGLNTGGTKFDSAEDNTFLARMKRTVPDYAAYKTEFMWQTSSAESLVLSKVNEVAKFAAKNIPMGETSRAFMNGIKQRAAFSLMFYTRMLFSCLVDADFLDTENFMSGGATGRGNFAAMTTLQSRLTQHVKTHFLDEDKPQYDTPINKKRREILRECLQFADQAAGLFSLTVPTGGGKTVASLAFAVNHAIAHKKRRIIYVIPYTSIIEQTATVFHGIVGEENVIEHHSNVKYRDGIDEYGTRCW